VRSARVFIVSGPSGTGKTSLIQALLRSVTRLELSISYTTRPIRPQEEHGSDYCFVTPAAFQKMIKEEQLLEYAEVFGNFYGTSRHRVRRQLDAGKDVLLEIDWQGARQVRRAIPDSMGIFILPPNFRSLQERLRRRGQDDEQVIQRRISETLADLSHCGEYNYQLINDDFDRALERLRDIVRSVRAGGPEALIESDVQEHLSALMEEARHFR